MIKIYGAPRTSAGRCYWMLEEAGVAYEQAPLDMRNKEHKSDTFLKINPNGKVPAMIDGNFVIYESMAINQYLAEKYKPELLGKTPEEQGLIAQWSFWAILEMQRPAVDWLIQEHFVPADKRDAALIEKCQKQLPHLMEILNNDLASKKFLVGNRFTLADLNVASVVNICMGLKMDISHWKNLANWMSSMKERPAFQKLIKLRS